MDDDPALNEALTEIIRELERILCPSDPTRSPPPFDLAFVINAPSDALEFFRGIPTGTAPEHIESLAREFEMRRVARARTARDERGGGA